MSWVTYSIDAGGISYTHVFDARLPAGLTVVLEVAVGEGDQPPGEREDDPADGERHGEEQQVPAPLDVDQRSEDVGQEAPTSSVDVDARHVAFAVFADQTTLAGARQQPPETLLPQNRRHRRAAAAGCQ